MKTHDEENFKLGELVTRDGTDVHRVIKEDEGYGDITVICIKAPESGWCRVGDVENNLGARYSRIEPSG